MSRVGILSPVLVTAPATVPVTLVDAKAYLRVEHSVDDDLITSLIASATRHLDGWGGALGRCLLTQTWQQARSGFPEAGKALRLPFPDIQSVEVTVLDRTGATQTMSAAAYHLINDARSGCIFLADGAAWPACATRPDAVTVTMVAGYGAAAAVPAPIKTAILQHVTALYERRTPVDADAQVPLPLGYEDLIAPFCGAVA